MLTPRMDSRAALNWAIPIWIAFAASWFVPALRANPDSPNSTFEGWRAFVLALAGAVDPDEVSWLFALCVVGVLSNVLVALTPWLFRRDPMPRWFAFALKAAFFANFGWIPAMRKAGLLPGYWLWLVSIGALALIAIVKRRSAPSPTTVRDIPAWPTGPGAS